MDYSTSSGSKVNPRSRIVVKLDRLLLDELELDPLLNAYSCLILDEAHERTLSIDVILGLVSNILKNRKDFKVVVTSATLNAELSSTIFHQRHLWLKLSIVAGNSSQTGPLLRHHQNFRTFC